MGRYILLTCFLLFIFSGYTQDFNGATWQYIDTSIERKHNLSDIHDLVQQLKQKAWADKKYFELARCYYYQVLIADQRTEDSFYFRNSAVFDSLLMTQPDKPALQWAIELLQAKRLSAFPEYHRFSKDKYGSKKIPVNYALYSHHQLDSIANIHFEKAIALAIKIPTVNTDDALWLSSDPLIFLFKPGLVDIAIAEQIGATKKGSYSPSAFFAGRSNYMQLPITEFIHAMDSLYIIDKNYFPALRYYFEWLIGHSSHRGVGDYIETLVRKYVYERIQYNDHPGPVLDKDYEQYLLEVSESGASAARAHAVFQLCLLWEKQAQNYFPRGLDYGFDLKGTYYEGISDYDTTYRLHALKALQLFEKNKVLLDSFRYFKEMLLAMEQRIVPTRVSITVPEYNLPGEPMLAELVYRNAGKLYYSIARVNTSFTFRYNKKDELIAKLRQLPEVAGKTIDIPATNDHNWHEAYLKLDGLPAGTYSLLFSAEPLTDSNKHIERLYLKITSIVIVDNKNYVFVLDRKTGFPLSGAIVKGYHEREKKDTLGLKKRKSKNYVVNEQGFVVIDDKNIENLEVYYKSDTSFARYSFFEEEFAEVYDKDEYDGLGDFYEENATVHVFTDRSIYRPGQTVQFKAILLTRNKNTGELMVMNEENMGRSFAKSVYKKWLKQSDPEIYLSDPFNRKTDTIKIKLSEYGSISGSFKIPKTAATGRWSIEPGYLDAEGGSFSIEEYKRPTYEISIENPKKELLPADTFSVKVKVRSFAGPALNNVRIHYTVKRSGQLPFVDPLTKRRRNAREEIQIADTIAYTNSEGESTVVIDDKVLRQFSLAKDKKWDFDYSITAEAIDGTGESYDITGFVRVSSRPVTIDLPVNKNYNRYEKNSIPVTAWDVNAGSVSKDLRVKIFKLVTDEKVYDVRRLKKADQWLYSREQLEKWFPGTQLSKNNIVKQLVIDTTINTGKIEKLDIDALLFPAGNYTIEAVCEDNGKILGESEAWFNVFDEKGNKLPHPSNEFYHLAYNSVSPGDTIRYYNGSSEGTVYSLYYLSWYSVKGKLMLSEHYEMIKQDKGIHQWKWKVPGDAAEKLLLTQVYVMNNQLFSNEEEIAITKRPAEEPEIIVEQYRKKLSPGSKETFSVSIKTKNENTAAELMTTLYDASLDKLQMHSWDKPEPGDLDLELSSEWKTVINSTINNYSYPYLYYNTKMFHVPGLVPSGRIEALGSTDLPINYNVLANFEFENVLSLGYGDNAGVAGGLNDRTAPLWWLNPPRYSDGNEDVMADWNVGKVSTSKNNPLGFAFDDDSPSSMGSQSLFGVKNQLQFGSLNITSVLANQRAQRQSLGLPERARRSLLCPSFDNIDVITTAVPFLRIGTNETKQLNVTIVRINKEFSLASYIQPMIILNGEPFKGDLATLEPATIVQGIILKGADAVEIFGPNAAAGVLVLSTNGNIILPESAFEPLLTTRKNFNESAFFFPAIHADKDGYYSFTFTMPESVTEWNWKMLAHTKNARFTYTERKLTTQLPLMVQPNIPRLLYQGDRIVLQNRISNLDSVDMNGKAVCRIEDVVTGEDITSSLLTKTENSFSVRKKDNVSSAFEIKVPKTQLNPVRVIVSVHSQGFADGEEHIIPVLSPKILVKKSVPFNFIKYTDTTIKAVTLPPNGELYGVGLSITPKPQSALVNALPYLANFSFDCAEQLFNKMIAYITALNLMRRDEEAQRSFDRAKKIIENRQEQKELPGELAEMATPWLNLDNKTIKQQRQLFELLDTNNAQEQVGKYLVKLYRLQNDDGGLTWFDGGKSNRYISNYILAGFGKLERDSLLHPEALDARYKRFIEELLAYCQKEFNGDVNEKTSPANLLFYAYAQSFWKNSRLLADTSLRKIREFLSGKWKSADKNRLSEQAILIVATLRCFDKTTDEYQKSIQLLHSIEQLAIRDDVSGTRWKELADIDDMGSSAEETLALLVEAFSEATMSADLVPGIIRWLLIAKTEDHWSSTKATAAVIKMLFEEKRTATGPTQTIRTRVNNKELSVTNDLLSGSSFSFAQQDKPLPVELKKENTGVAAGHAIWYYFSAADELNDPDKKVNLQKQLSRYNVSAFKWEPIDEKTDLKIADKIQVTLTIETSNPLRYVYIDDKRAAAFEPKENSSGYRYTAGLNYYLSVRDAGMQFFCDFIPSGSSVVTYEMIVAQEGSFSNGPAMLQCMYKPEVNAYSNSITIQASR